MITLSRLFVHPVKSLRGMQVSHAQALKSGLAFDRIFMLTETDGTFITARQYPEMVLFTPALIMGGLHLTAPDGSSATIRFDDFLPEYSPTEVWGNKFTALIAPDDINQWLSGFFPHQVQLRWVGPEMTRRVKKFAQVPLGFADGFPYMLLNEASLQDLQQRCPVNMCIEQFRPSLTITGAEAWDEDNWATIKIGDVIFDVAKACSRCIFTTINPQSGHKHPEGEPLETLRRFRTAQDGGSVDFGINLIARNSGILRAGDPLEVLESKPARLYGGQQGKTLSAPVKPSQEVTLIWGDQTFTGNNQQVLLEQLEMQGIDVPYSCRAGICGSCKITLVSGEVSPLKSSAIREDGTILCCSCIPAGDLILR